MRFVAGACALLVGTLSASAQDSAATPAEAVGATAKPALVRPILPAAAETYRAMPLAERIGIQFDLIWGSDYDGLANGEDADRTVASIKAFQKKNKFKETGVLNPKERKILAAGARAQRDVVGWRMVEDAVTASRVGLPSKLLPQAARSKSGSRWSSAHDEAVVETFRIKQPDASLAAIFDQQKKEPADRQIKYSLLLPDFFVISGLQGAKNFYVRGQLKNQEVRGFSALYGHAMEGAMDKAVAAMSSAFAPIRSAAAATPASSPSKRKVEYGTGIVVSGAGHIIAPRNATDGCEIVLVPGLGDADPVAEDAGSNLALLRVYGHGDLVPLAFAGDAPSEPDLTVVGVADPQAQAGGNAASAARARFANASGGEATRALNAAPAPGFAGAAAIDGRNGFLGMVQIKPQIFAEAGAASLPPPASIIPAATIRNFLETQSVNAVLGHAGIADAKASVVRVICVRK
jgi:hypothetical protein